MDSFPLETIGYLEAQPLGIVCGCVTKHVPKVMEFHNHHIVPKYMGGRDIKANKQFVCPTAHANIHHLIDRFEEHGVRPPGSVLKHYSSFVIDLAQRGWDGRDVNYKTD